MFKITNHHMDLIRRFHEKLHFPHVSHCTVVFRRKHGDNQVVSRIISNMNNIPTIIFLPSAKMSQKYERMRWM